jgi:NADPH:quinone reductase-like Zn-dependent oxidoreductase
MKAARIHDYGHSDQIKIENISVPAQTSTDVLVRIDAAGVNPVDWKIREGLARFGRRDLPFTLGQDFSGQVIAVGADIDDIEADEEVYGFASGAYAEFAVVRPDWISNRPVTIDDATAATLPTPGLTAMQMVRAVDPRPGQVVLIHGAGGAVGSIATQLVLEKGARVIANAGGHDTEYLRSLGVDLVIDYNSHRFDDLVRDADAVIDVVGGDTLARSFAITKRGGAIATALGPLDDEKIRAGAIRAFHIVMQRNSADLLELARLVDAGTIKPRHPRVLPLDQASSAQDLTQTHQTSDKVVLEIH